MLRSDCTSANGWIACTSFVEAETRNVSNCQFDHPWDFWYTDHIRKHYRFSWAFGHNRRAWMNEGRLLWPGKPLTCRQPCLVHWGKGSAHPRRHHTSTDRFHTFLSARKKARTHQARRGAESAVSVAVLSLLYCYGVVVRSVLLLFCSCCPLLWPVPGPLAGRVWSCTRTSWGCLALSHWIHHDLQRWAEGAVETTRAAMVNLGISSAGY